MSHQLNPRPRGVLQISRFLMVGLTNIHSGEFYYLDLDIDHETETPDFPPAADMHRYLVSYAKHFGILPRAQLNTVVHRAEWNPDTGLWDIETTTDGEPSIVRSFDKVVYSMGPDQIPNIPSIPGFDLFEGEAVHSIAFKRYATCSVYSLNSFLTI